MGRFTQSRLQSRQDSLRGGWIRIFLDILYCFRHYKMWSNQYLKENFWTLSEEQRKEIGSRYLEEGRKRDEWTEKFLETYRFLQKWTSYRWSSTIGKRAKRIEAYRKFYNMGKNCFIEHNVEITRQHYLPGTLKVGNHVTFAKHVFIDYSGHVMIGDDVGFADGAYVLTHDHKHQHEAKSKNEIEDDDIQGYLEICDGAIIGARAIIMPTCHRIGKFARIGTGAVVSKDVPDYAVVMSPAAIILNPKALKGRPKDTE